MKTRNIAKSNESELAYVLRDWDKITRPFKRFIWVKKYEKGVKVLKLGE